MGRPDYKWCRDCQRHTSVVGVLSHTRLCAECGERRALENNREMARHDGPGFDHWRRRNYMAARRFLLDGDREQA